MVFFEMPVVLAMSGTGSRRNRRAVICSRSCCVVGAPGILDAKPPMHLRRLCERDKGKLASGPKAWRWRGRKGKSRDTSKGMKRPLIDRVKRARLAYGPRPSDRQAVKSPASAEKPLPGLAITQATSPIGAATSIMFSALTDLCDVCAVR